MQILYFIHFLKKINEFCSFWDEKDRMQKYMINYIDELWRQVTFVFPWWQYEDDDIKNIQAKINDKGETEIEIKEENIQASDSGVGSHSPSPDLASDGEEGPRNKRFDGFFNNDENDHGHH